MKFKKTLTTVLLILFFTGMIIAQETTTSDNDSSERPSNEERKPPKPPIPSKYYEDEPTEPQKPQIKDEDKPIVQFLYDGKLTEKVNQLFEFSKQLIEVFKDKIIVQATDINEDEIAKNDWNKILENKGMKESDVIVLIIERTKDEGKFIIGLNDIIQTLASHINFALEPDKYTDPSLATDIDQGVMRSRNYATKPQWGPHSPQQQAPITTTGTIEIKNDEYKEKFTLLLTVFIAFIAFVVGIFIAWLIFKNKKSVTPTNT